MKEVANSTIHPDVTEVDQTPQQMPSGMSQAPLSESIRSKEIRNYTPLFIVLLMCVVGLLASYVYQPKTTQPQSSDLSQIKTTADVIVPTRIPEITQKAQSWILKKTVNGVSQKEFALCDDCIGMSVGSWGDWIFYSGFENNNNIRIFGYNIKARTTTTLYDVSKNTHDFQGNGIRLPSDVVAMQIIDDTLYFSLGGYMTSGGIFWMDLPPGSKPQKLMDSSYSKILFWKNKHWIIGGFGDGCAGSTDYSLIDVHTKKVTHIASSIEGCVEGEEYIEIDKRNRMILASHTAFSGDDQISDSGGEYQYVIAVPLTTPSVKEGVISNQDMPKHVKRIVYLPDSDQLLLMGPENYIFDFSTNSIQKTTSIPVLPKSDSPQFPDRTTEASIRSLKLPAGYEFVLE